MEPNIEHTLKDQKQSSTARKNTLEKKPFTIKTQRIKAKVQIVKLQNTWKIFLTYILL